MVNNLPQDQRLVRFVNSRSNYISNKNTLRRLLILAIPTIVEEILSTLLQYVDTAMVGRLSAEATAAVNVTTTISWLVGSLFSSFGIGVLAMLAKAEGAGEYEKLRTISKQALFLVLAVGFVLGGASLALSPVIPTLMGAEKKIRKSASIYFFIISLPMVFRCATSIFGSALRAVKDAKTPLYITIACNVLNVGLNYTLIYIAGLGVTGAAISSAVSYTLMGTLMYLAYRKNVKLAYPMNSFFVSKEVLSECFKVSTPVLFTSITSCLGYVVFASLVSSMGTITFAAHSIAVTAETIFYIAGYGLRTATSTLVGNAVGSKDDHALASVSRLSIVVTVCMMVVSGILLYAVSGILMSLLSTNVKVIELGTKMLKLVAFSEPFFGLMIVSEGIYYGQSKTRYPFIVETFCMWGIRILFTFLVVKVYHMGLTQVWYCMIADNVVKAALLSLPIFVSLAKSGRRKEDE